MLEVRILRGANSLVTREFRDFQGTPPFRNEMSSARIAINLDQMETKESQSGQAFLLVNRAQTKHSARDRMLANSHAGRGPASNLEVSQTTQYKRVLSVLTQRAS